MLEKIREMGKIEEAIIAGLQEKGLLADEISEVMEVLRTKVVINVESTNVDINLGNTITLRTLNRKGEPATAENTDQLLQEFDIEANVQGLDPMCIVGIEFQPFRFDQPYPAVIKAKIEILPLATFKLKS
jgi:hypothetical protein